jgi:hypothetical protein
MTIETIWDLSETWLDGDEKGLAKTRRSSLELMF